MQLNLKTDYSLRLLLFLALYPGELVPVSRVAKAFRISTHHLGKVAQSLAAGGFVELVRGRGGGMRLALDPDHVAIDSVIRQLEGTFALVECFETTGNTCSIAPVCGLKKVLAEAQAAFFSVLKRYTLADIVGNPGVLRRILERS